MTQGPGYSHSGLTIGVTIKAVATEGRNLVIWLLYRETKDPTGRQACIK